MKKTIFIVQAALIAAIYATFTIGFAPLSYGPVQIRFAEALTILPALTPVAIPGLFVGCIIANIYGMMAGLGLGILDIVFGSLATLIAALLTYKLAHKKYLVPLPPVLVNAVVIGVLINYLTKLPLLPSIAWVGVGQLVACYGLGYPLLIMLSRYKKVIFKVK